VSKTFLQKECLFSPSAIGEIRRACHGKLPEATRFGYLSTAIKIESEPYLDSHSFRVLGSFCI
jgi:hypothetical protein